MRSMLPLPTALFSTLVLVLLVGSGACFPTVDDGDEDGGGACPETTLGCDCGPEQSCEAGLVCDAGRCIRDGRDWFTSSCNELEGTQTGAGACYFACSSNGDCGFGTQCCNLPYQPYCRMGRGCGDHCATDADCGPAGWVCHQEACYLTCAADTAGVQAEDCPVGFSCQTDPHEDWIRKCITIDDDPGCGGGNCPAACCSPSGLSCCAPPFCGGDCVGSPCC